MRRSFGQIAVVVGFLLAGAQLWRERRWPRFSRTFWFLAAFCALWMASLLIIGKLK